MRPKNSVVWLLADAEFTALIRESQTYTDVLRKLRLRAAGGNHKTLQKRIQAMGLDVRHFDAGAWEARRHKTVLPLDEVMVEGSTYSRSHLKKRLLRNGMLRNVCSACEQEGTWKGEPLVMVLDHINGVWNDNRIENLRMLCPNCNSQQDTFAGRKQRKQRGTCAKCNMTVSLTAKHCRKCVDKSHSRKATRPTPDVLQEQITRLGWCGTARLYGVSDNAIRKWVK